MTRNEAIELMVGLSIDEFADKVKEQKLSKARIILFFNIIKGATEANEFLKIDIEEYALKIIYSTFFNNFKIIEHLYSTCDLYSFDPAKNGQNVLKHGISFGEVVSYSKKFGTLNIPCPDHNDKERIVSFSDFYLENKYKIQFPLKNIESPSCCISIITKVEGRFRFISSRLLSSKKTKYTKSIYQSLRGIKFNDEKSKILFVNRCVEIIERDLI